MQGFFNIHKSINAIHHINKLKHKHHLITSIDTEKAFDKIQHSLMIKTLQKMGIDGNYPNILKARSDKSTANIILNGEKLKAFPLRSGRRQGYPLSPLLFNIVLEVLATAIREEKEIKGIHIGKEEVKLLLFADDMILYIENHKDSIRILLELISEFCKFQETKSIYRNHLYFYILIMKNQKEKLRNQSLSPLQKKRIKHLGIDLPKETKELYTENCKTQMKEIKDAIDRWRNIPCSWVGRINTVKITTLPNVIYRFNVISIKLPMAFFTELEQKISQSYGNTKDPE